MTLAAVLDAGPLIHLAEIDSLYLLTTFDSLTIPKTVHEELKRGNIPDELSDLSFEFVEADDDSLEADELDPGELAALAIAEERTAILLTDDLAAREAASEMGLEVHGSIGAIALGHAQGFLDRDEAATMMRELQRKTSLYVSEAVVERGIRMMDEE